MGVDDEGVSGVQVDAAAMIERESARLKELALRMDLRFLAYLLDMAREEASGLSRAGRRVSAGATIDSVA